MISNIELAKKAVKNRFYPNDQDDTIVIVWFAYVLGNFKAIVISTKDEDDTRIFEVTYRKDGRLFVDEYQKKTNSEFKVGKGGTLEWENTTEDFHHFLEKVHTKRRTE